MLAECHAHIMLDGENIKTAKARHAANINIRYIENVFSEYKKRSIHFIRDGGDNAGVSEAAKELARKYGIDYATPVFAIHKKGLYGSIVGKSFDDFAEYKILVSEAVSRGADFIKIMATGILDFDIYGKVSEGYIPYEQLSDLISFAHDNDLSVMVHVNGAERIMDCAKAGADSIEHGFYQNDESICAMKEFGSVWVPTLVAAKNLTKIKNRDNAVLEKIVLEHEKNIIKAFHNGNFVASGSDAGAYNVRHAEGTIEEYNALIRIFEDKASINTRIAESVKVIKKKFLKRKYQHE